MTYTTTYYFGNREAGRAFARQAAKVAGRSTYAETAGFWTDGDILHTDIGASVTVGHSGGMRQADLNARARLAAFDHGEAEVYQVTTETLSAHALDARDYGINLHPDGGMCKHEGGCDDTTFIKDAVAMGQDMHGDDGPRPLGLTTGYGYGDRHPGRI